MVNVVKNVKWNDIDKENLRDFYELDFVLLIFSNFFFA